MAPLVKKMWSLGNQTLMEWNDHELIVGDFTLDLDRLTLGEIMRNILFLIEVAGSCKLINFIMKYLDEKPPGRQTLMDAYHKIMFRTIKMMALAASIHVILKRICLDPGDLVTKIVMWPSYDTVGLATITVALNPLIQLLLASSRGRVELPISDTWTSWIINGVLWIPAIIMNVICSSLGYYTNGYYLLRHQEPKYLAFRYVRFGVFVICIIAYLIARLIISKIYGKDREPSRHLLNSKVNMFGSFSILMMLLSLWFGYSSHTAEILTFLLGISLPAVIITTNKNLLERARRSKALILRVVIAIHTYCKAKRDKTSSSNNLELRDIKPN